MTVEFVRPGSADRWLEKTRPESTLGEEMASLLQAGEVNPSWWKSPARDRFALFRLYVNSSVPERLKAS